MTDPHPVSMTTPSFSGVESLSHSAIFVDVDGMQHEFPTERANGLVEPNPDGIGAVVLTGIHTGVVSVSAQTYEGEPPLDGTWEDVAEISIEVVEGWIEVYGLLGSHSLPTLTVPDGSYRLRVHANHRGHNRDGVDDEPVEEYLLVLWPGPPAPQRVHRMTNL